MDKLQNQQIPAEPPGERYDWLIENGRKFNATSESIDIRERPNFFHEERFARAQLKCQKYYTNLSMASSTGLMLILQVESIALPLLKTGKSRTVPDLCDRYMDTARYIRTLYETNFHDQNSEGWRYLNLVRAMHQRIYKLMNDDQDSKMEPPNVWVNQYDMALTQFAFVGLFLVSPEKCGAYHVTRADLEDVTYYWRVLSYYFGIEDQFNIFVYDNDADKQVEMMQLILNHLKRLLARPRLEAGLAMAEGFTLAFEDFASESSFNILDHWWSPIVSISGRQELKPYTWTERWKLIWFFLYFKVVFKSELALSIMNHYYKKKFDEFLKSREKIKERLAKRHKDFICEL